MRLILLALQRYMKTLIHPLYNRLGFEAKPSDSHLEVSLRANAISWACSLGIQECKEKAKVEYKRWMDEINPDAPGANP